MYMARSPSPISFAGKRSNFETRSFLLPCEELTCDVQLQRMNEKHEHPLVQMGQIRELNQIDEKAGQEQVAFDISNTDKRSLPT